MAFSMHSHSGQFCPGHAKDSLEEIVLQAISLKMQLLAVTEHMPRDQDKDLYPDEIEIGCTVADLRPLHDAYIKEAIRLRDKYKHEIKILIGFEGEWIRPSSAALVNRLLEILGTDFFVGSVHHVHEIPIDFDKTMYQEARRAAGGSDERLFEDYFDAQYEMLTALRPRVVGHFDLIRLLSDDPDRDLKGMGSGIWNRVLRNLDLVKERGALMEVNSSALRKGLKEPYPGRSICEAFLKIGGRLTLSDDSHGVAQIGLNYGGVSRYLKSLGVEEVYCLERHVGGAETQLELLKVPLKGMDTSYYPSSSLP